MCFSKYLPSYGIRWCAVTYLQSKRLRNGNRAADHHAKLLAAARPLLEVALASDRGRGASPVAGDATPPGELAADVPSPPTHSTHSDSRKRPVLYHWQFVSPQLLNSKGEEIFYPVVDDTDRSWARRLEWAIDCHRDLAEADLNRLQAEFERVLRTSREAVGRRDDRFYIKSLQKQLECAHERFRNLRMP